MARHLGKKINSLFLICSKNSEKEYFGSVIFERSPYYPSELAMGFRLQTTTLSFNTVQDTPFNSQLSKLF
jgi:hypothetical protein